ncbi:MAG: alpha/beta hydrolase fold protein [Pedobacter sp.]|jgi:pimeloyl-ACP methyl ester carboxylesterase|nr:alpha/beta hydrolase fold protein [Pedobacter sp.]
MQHQGKSSVNFKLLAAGLWFLIGRYAVSYLVSSRKKQGRLRQIPPLSKQHIQCPSGNIWYAELDGPQHAQPIVLIHGLQSTRLQWYYQQKELRNKYKVVLLDLPGHGKSGTAISLSIPIMAADLNHILKQLSINKPYLYGHSIGGMTLLNYCINYNNNHIKGVILQNCSYTDPMKTCLFPGFMQFIEKPLIVPYLHFVKRHSIAFSLLSRINFLSGLSIVFYRFLLFSGPQSAKELRQLCRVAALCPAYVSADGILSTLKQETAPLLHRITAPCLVIGSENDRIIRPQTAYSIGDAVQNGRISILAGGHLNLIEYAEEVNAVVNDFLRTTI